MLCLGEKGGLLGGAYPVMKCEVYIWGNNFIRQFGRAPTL